jgi:hypothetical protein
VDYVLVYQVGIANVFKLNPFVRVLQHAYRPCEHFCSGLIEAGKVVGVSHCDMAGDVAHLRDKWKDGAGDLWIEKKYPPIATGV